MGVYGEIQTLGITVGVLIYIDRMQFSKMMEK